METDEEPLLALYAWHGSLEPNVAFTEGALSIYELDGF